MKKIGSSTLYVEKYRPQSFEDIIAPATLHTYLQNIIKDGDVANLMFSGPAGTGKTTTALAIVKELGADLLHLNAALDNSINDIRFKVRNFATTKSLFSDTKIAIIDEADRLSGGLGGGQDSLKVLIEESSSNCRFIFITNNITKMIEPLTSRCQSFSFGTNENDKKTLLTQFFKRAQFILDEEKVKYDKGVLAEFVTSVYPDFRKILNELQKFVKAHGEIDERIFSRADSAVMLNLIDEMKSKSFDKVREIAGSIDWNIFYSTFYQDMKTHIENSSIPDTVVILAEYAHRHGFSIDQELNGVACLTELMRGTKWKK